MKRSTSRMILGAFGLGFLARLGWLAVGPFLGLLLVGVIRLVQWAGSVQAAAWWLGGAMVLLAVLRLYTPWAVREVRRAMLQSPSDRVRHMAGWSGELYEVYVYWWPPERLLPEHLRGKKLGGRRSYIGRAVDEEDRAKTHARQRREFVLPYHRREVFAVPTFDEMVQMEKDMIRDAIAAGEPIVNKQLYGAVRR